MREIIDVKKVVLLICLVLTAVTYGQSLDTLKVMSYNLLKFPAVAPERIDTLKEILAYVKPDILMVCELTDGEGAEDILFNALNEDGESAYDMADFVSGPDTQNELYFNSEKLVLYEQNTIPTDLRDINEYVLYHKSDDLETAGDTVFFYIYVCHLKASSGYEEQRHAEITDLKNYLTSRETAENILIGGDFNFYGSETEPAWNTLLNEGVLIRDPISTPGNWHADPGFAWLHTQSTRTEDFNGGAYGGMDDRFDFIFIGTDLRTFENDARYINGSYRAIGQDGLHYNDAINAPPTNDSEPEAIISKLYYMSDHLPVYLEIEVVKEAAGITKEVSLPFEVYYDSENDCIQLTWKKEEPLSNQKGSIYSVEGQLMITINHLDPCISTQFLTNGTYFFKVEGYPYSLKFVK